METHSLYGGEVTLVYDPYKHKYFVDDEEIEGVTTSLKVISKPALVPWCAKVSSEYVAANLKPGVSLDEIQIKTLVEGTKSAHRNRVNAAADIGTLGHEWAEQYILGQNPAMPVNEQLRGIATAVKKFVKEHEIRVVNTEQKIYSRQYKYAGTLDLNLYFEDVLAIGDFKTGSGIYAEVYAQLGAYSYAVREESGNDIKAHVAINIQKTGDLFVGVSKEVERNEKAFLDALSLHRSLKEIESERKRILKKVA